MTKPIHAGAKGSITTYSRALTGGTPLSSALCLTARAKHPISHYMGYRHSCVHTSVHPQFCRTRPVMEFSQRNAKEWLTRDRRAIFFTDASGMRPLRRPGAHRKLCLDVAQHVDIDHETVWLSETGGVYLLSEPYDGYENYDRILTTHSYCVIEVPVNISPYCGGWKDTPGQLPSTRSFVITKSKNYEDLLLIAGRLSAAVETLPAWNDVSEVSCA
jgi:hypothetical protein